MEINLFFKIVFNEGLFFATNKDLKNLKFLYFKFLAKS